MLKRKMTDFALSLPMLLAGGASKSVVQTPPPAAWAMASVELSNATGQSILDIRTGNIRDGAKIDYL